VITTDQSLTPEEEVEARWRWLLDNWRYPIPEFEEATADLIRSAFQRPALRRLAPFTSHYRLGFSVTTHYPWDLLLYVYPMENLDGVYQAVTSSGRLLLRGDMAIVLDAAVASLPDPPPRVTHDMQSSPKSPRLERRVCTDCGVAAKADAPFLHDVWVANERPIGYRALHRVFGIGLRLDATARHSQEARALTSEGINESVLVLVLVGATRTRPFANQRSNVRKAALRMRPARRVPRVQSAAPLWQTDGIFQVDFGSVRSSKVEYAETGLAPGRVPED